MGFDPISIGLSGLSALGGLFGGHGRKQQTIDPEMLRKLFGPDAIGRDTNALYGQLTSSPYFSQLLQNAATQGQGMSSKLNGRLAASGLAGGGATSGVGSIAQTLGSGYANSLQGQAKSNTFAQAMQAAMANLQQQQGIYANSFQNAEGNNAQQSSFGQRLGNSIGGAAAAGLAAYQPKGRQIPNSTVPNNIYQAQPGYQLPGAPVGNKRGPAY